MNEVRAVWSTSWIMMNPFVTHMDTESDPVNPVQIG